MKKIIFFIILIILIINCFGCQSVIHENKDNSSVSDIKDVSPVPKSSVFDEISVNLFYGFYGEQLLAKDTRNISVSVNDSIEANILQFLISDSSALSLEYTRVVNPKTRVVNVDSNDGYIFVTFSKDFLLPPDNFSFDNMKENVRKYLAAYSVINTLIEYGNYYRVQILIDRDDTGSGTPITESECGLVGEDDFEPHGYNSNIVLDSSNTMKEIMSSLEEKNWNRLYNYIASENDYISLKPSFDEFQSVLTNANPTISDSAIVGVSSGTNEFENLVFITYTVSVGNSEALSVTDMPVQLFKEHGVWKLSYKSFLDYFINIVG